MSTEATRVPITPIRAIQVPMNASAPRILLAILWKASREAAAMTPPKRTKKQESLNLFIPPNLPKPQEILSITVVLDIPLCEDTGTETESEELSVAS